MIKTASSIYLPLQDISRWVADPIGKIVQEAFKNISSKEIIEEIRLRVNQPIAVRTDKKDYFLPIKTLAGNKEQTYIVTKEDLVTSLEKMTFSSIYAAEEKLRQGFLTLPGGHRVGLAGETVVEFGRIKTLKNISALNIRLARQCEVEVSGLLVSLMNKNKNFCHTLLVSPPRAGKTTILRLLIRHLSNGLPQIGLEGQVVGVVDERSEIAGMCQGIPAFDLGCRTDVLDCCPKALGINMLIRTMSPAVVAVDELGGAEDIAAVKDAIRCGVKVLATVHADSLEELKKREHIKELLTNNAFERVVVLSRAYGPGTIEGIYDLNSGINLRPIKKELPFAKSNSCC
ncbi:MAG: stage III sporulation protein AA [Peptococcaceae bacterium]|nr:stage III sporulation protein AA [Peptococcaceae bacterium]